MFSYLFEVGRSHFKLGRLALRMTQLEEHLSGLVVQRILVLFFFGECFVGICEAILKTPSYAYELETCIDKATKSLRFKTTYNLRLLRNGKLNVRSRRNFHEVATSRRRIANSANDRLGDRHRNELVDATRCRFRRRVSSRRLSKLNVNRQLVLGNYLGQSEQTVVIGARSFVLVGPYFD